MKKSTLLLAAGLVFTLQMTPAMASSLQEARQAIEAQEYGKAMEQLRLLMRDGDHDATNLLGQMYENGWGVAADADEATRLYMLGADQGHLDSITSLRALRNKAYAVDFDRLLPLAEAGNTQAQNDVGLMYEYGRGVDRDPAKAYYWYQQAAAQDDVAGWHNLGRSYNFGIGTEQNFERAEALYLQAVERGHTAALFYLGTLYATDHGSDTSYSSDIIAYAWLKTAADTGDKTARPIAERLLLKLTDEEIEIAKDLATRYHARYVTP